MEVVSQSLIAKKQAFLREEDFNQLYEKSEELARMLSCLKSRLSK